MSDIAKYLLASLLGLVALVEPSFKFAFVLFFAVMLDCFSAYDLSRRLKRAYPDQVCGKFKSQYALKMLRTFVQAYSAVLLLYMVDKVLLDGVMSLSLSNIGAALFCAIQLWSVLENISSGNGAKWAKALQRIMVDKAKRHFDVDLSNNKQTTEKSEENLGNAADDGSAGTDRVQGQ
jgi:hypothetical protein